MTYERTREKILVDFDWKEEGVEDELRNLHADSFSATEIAYRLTQKFGGMLTRSAVLGKINRIGLSVHHHAVVWKGEFIAELNRLRGEGLHASHIADKLTQQFGVTFTKSAVYHKINRLGRSVKSKARNKNSRRSPPLTPSLKSPYPPMKFPSGQRKQILDLKESDCRWPYGDVGKPDFFFCGGEIELGHSYCGFHCRMAYQR